MEISVPIPVFIEFECNSKTLDRLSDQMSYDDIRRIDNGMACIPDSMTQIKVFEVIVEPLIEPTELFE